MLILVELLYHLLKCPGHNIEVRSKIPSRGMSPVNQTTVSLTCVQVQQVNELIVYKSFSLCLKCSPLTPEMTTGSHHDKSTSSGRFIYTTKLPRWPYTVRFIVSAHASYVVFNSVHPSSTLGSYLIRTAWADLPSQTDKWHPCFRPWAKAQRSELPDAVVMETLLACGIFRFRTIPPTPHPWPLVHRGICFLLLITAW